MIFEIKNRFNGQVQFTTEIDCDEDASRGFKIGLAVKQAYRQSADLRNSNLRCADLRNVDLRHADLQGADLRHADLKGADLRHADLKGADLQHADLQGCNLIGANLRDSNLRDANLKGANLLGCDLLGADLTVLSFEDLWGARNIGDRVIDGGLLSNGYRLLLTRTEPGEWRVKDFDRNLTLTDAIHYWSQSNYRDRTLEDEALLVIENMRRIAEHRQWPKV